MIEAVESARNADGTDHAQDRGSATDLLSEVRRALRETQHLGSAVDAANEICSRALDGLAPERRTRFRSALNEATLLPRVDRVWVVEQRRAELALDPSRPVRVPTGPSTPVHSSEISARAFRTAIRGLDPHGVTDWLRVVEASHAALEDELERLRRGWDEMLIASADLRSAISASPATQARWGSLARTIGIGRPDPQLVTMDTGSTRDALAGAVRGRRRTKAALASAGVQLARMQHRAALLQRSNEQLRSQLIDTLTEA